MHNLMATQYGLAREDQDTVFRLMQYGNNMTGLTEKEKRTLVARGLMDGSDMKLTPPDEFIFRGTITSAFWLKCLLALHGLIDFSGGKNESQTPSK